MNRYLLHVFAAFLIAFGLLAGALLYWQVLSGPELLARQDNPRPYELKTRETRGRIWDRNGRVIVESVAVGDRFERRHRYSPLVHVTGYDSPRYGSTGVEASRQAELTGSVGESAFAAWWGRTLGVRRPTADVTLTIDIDVQRVADVALGPRNGAVVLLEAKTGGILALAGHPYFDPADLERHWDQLRAEAERPFLNRATQGLYAPGSLFTLITLAAALEEGAAGPTETFPDLPSELRLGGTVITSTLSLPPDQLDLMTAFRISHPVFFARLGLELGWDRFLGMLRPLILDVPLALEIEFESPGLPAPSMLSDADLASTAIGQGRLSVTPLQMAEALAALVGDGTRPPLHLTLSPPALGSPVRIVSPAVASRVRAMMTSRESAVSMSVLGKSGITRLGPGVEPHTWYLGAFPADDPRWVVCVLIENGGPDESQAKSIGQAVLQAVTHN